MNCTSSTFIARSWVQSPSIPASVLSQKVNYKAVKTAIFPAYFKDIFQRPPFVASPEKLPSFA